MYSKKLIEWCAGVLYNMAKKNLKTALFGNGKVREF